MQTKKYTIPFLFLLITLFAVAANAADGIKWSELRLFFAGSTFSKEPTALNNLSAPDSVEKLTGLTGFGLEADFQYKPWLKVGTRFKGVWNSVYPPNPPSPATAYLQVSQYSAGVLARFPLKQSDFFVADLFTEVGLANTKIDAQTISSGKGTFTNDSGVYGRAGASAGIGTQSTKFYVELGQEWNNMNSMSYQGTLSTTVTSADFSGTYFAIGLIFSGLPSWIKPGGITVGSN